MRYLVATLLLAAAVPSLAFAQTGSAPAAGAAPTLSASHARSAMTDFGCSAVHSVAIAPDGAYHGTCTKGGSTINVKMEKDGKVSQTTGVQHVTEGRARYAMTDFGCTNISTMDSGPGGIWHAQCTKGGAPIQVMVDDKGVASATKVKHITEPAARSMLTDYGCSNLSALSMGADGGWYGQCTKGGSTKSVSVSSSGQLAAK